MATALFISLLLGPPVIRWLRAARRPGGARGRPAVAPDPRPARRPWAARSSSCPRDLDAAVGELTNPFVVISMLVLVWLGSLGFLDDYLKVVRRRTEGLVGKYKLVGQGCSACSSAPFMLFCTR
jgi:UDP-N-acetylmuramyl pentapeptide phosphotransferase/UDP-N-acetylglucosamine-1-phosphate transferase